MGRGGGETARRFLLETGVGAGVLAALVLVLLVLAAGLPFWVGLLAAVGTFGGLTLLLPLAKSDEAARQARAEAARALRDGSEKVEAIRRLAGRVAKPEVRAGVEEIASVADGILATIGERPPDGQTARTFLDRYLVPTETLLTQYTRLAARRVASAEPALAKIEDEDLPLVGRKLRELYDQLHRGDVIDLEVASEMLEFNLDGIDAPSPRRLHP